MAKPVLSPLAERVARKYAARFGYRIPSYVDRSDFLPVALLAAWKAEQRFIPGKGASLESWVKGYVWNALLNHLAKEDHLSRERRQGRQDDDLTTEYRRPLSLDHLLAPDDKGLTPDRELLAGAERPVAADGYTRGLIAEVVRRAVSRLPACQQEAILRCYWLQESQAEAAQQMAVYRQQVSRWVLAAQAELRQSLTGVLVGVETGRVPAQEKNP